MFSTGTLLLVSLQCERGGHYPHSSGHPSSSSFLWQSPEMCLCVSCCIGLPCFSTEGGIVKAPVQPQVMLLIERDLWSSHLYQHHFKCLDFGEKENMAESWHNTSWEFQIHFLVKYLFIKAVFRWWLKNVLYGMLQIPGRLLKLTQLLANSFAFEDYSESALVSSSEKVHTGCDTMTSHTEKQ